MSLKSELCNKDLKILDKYFLLSKYYYSSKSYNSYRGKRDTLDYSEEELNRMVW